MVPAQPDAGRHELGSARQREHAAERAPDRDEQRGEEQGDVPRELLPEEQAHHRARPDQGAVRLRDSGGAAPQGRSRRADEPDPPRGRRSPHRQRRVHRSAASQVAAGRLHRPPRSALRRRSSRRCSACSSTRRRIRVRTTTPAGRSRWCATSRATAIDDKAILDAADDAGRQRTSRLPARSPAPGRVLDRRSHDRQHARDVPLPARRT